MKLTPQEKLQLAYDALLKAHEELNMKYTAALVSLCGSMDLSAQRNFEMAILQLKLNKNNQGVIMDKTREYFELRCTEARNLLNTIDDSMGDNDMNVVALKVLEILKDMPGPAAISLRETAQVIVNMVQSLQEV